MVKEGIAIDKERLAHKEVTPEFDAKYESRKEKIAIEYAKKF
jgi:hypothetical protein